MTQTEALTLALEAHKKNERHRTLVETRYWCDQYKLLATQAIEALAQEKALQALHDENERLGLYKDAYAQQEQEPVGYFNANSDGKWEQSDSNDGVPFYAALPPQPKEPEQEPVACPECKRLEDELERANIKATVWKSAHDVEVGYNKQELDYKAIGKQAYESGYSTGYMDCAVKMKAQPEQKYRRGNRLICLETEEYCVIHISGTDRQWVKFPDSHIGVYTNEQVAELFELLPKETEQEFTNDWSEWRGMVVQNLMRHGIDKDFARRLAHFYQDKAPQPKEPEQRSVSEHLEPVALNKSGIQKLLKQSGFDNATPEETAAFISGIRHREAEMLDTTPPPVTESHKRKPLSGYINGAGINANDLPHIVVEKLERAIEAAHGIRPTDFKEKNT